MLASIEKVFDNPGKVAIATFVATAIGAITTFWMTSLLSEPQFEVPRFDYDTLAQCCEFQLRNTKETVESFHMILECPCSVVSASAEYRRDVQLVCRVKGNKAYVQNHPVDEKRGFLTNETILGKLLLATPMSYDDFDVLVRIMGKGTDTKDWNFWLKERYNRSGYLPLGLSFVVAFLIIVALILKYRKTRRIKEVFGNELKRYFSVFGHLTSKKQKEGDELELRFWIWVYLRFRDPASPRARSLVDHLKRETVHEFMKRKRPSERPQLIPDE